MWQYTMAYKQNAPRCDPLMDLSWPLTHTTYQVLNFHLLSEVQNQNYHIQTNPDINKAKPVPLYVVGLIVLHDM